MLDIEESHVKRAMIANAAEVVAVSAADKLGSAGPYVIAPLEELTYVVTEREASAEQLDGFRAAGIRSGARLMRGTRVALTFVFLADGVMVGSWASRIPAVKDGLDLLDLAARARAVRHVSGSARLDAARRVAGQPGRERSHRPRRAARGRGVALVCGVAGSLGALASAVLALFGAGFGAVNVAGNAQGIALERAYGRWVPCPRSTRRSAPAG